MLQGPSQAEKTSFVESLLVWVSMSQCGDIIVSEWPIVGEGPQRSNFGAIHIKVRTIADNCTLGPLAV